MIDCPNGDVRDLLPDFLHDGLEPSRRQAVARHLEGCAACRDELELLRTLRGVMQRAPRVDVPSVVAAIPPYRTPARGGWATSWRTAAAVAAIALGGTAIALVARTSHTPRASAPPVAVAPPARSPEAVVPPAPGIAQQPAPQAPRVATRATPPAREARPEAGRELAMAGGAITDLSDSELSSLLDDIESLDALPSTEVDGTEPLSPGRRGGRR